MLLTAIAVVAIIQVQRGKSVIFLKNLSEFDIAHLIKKGGLLLYSLNWERYQEHNFADRFLVLKTRKQNHSINRRVTGYNIRIHSEKELNTTKIWRNRQYWAYIPPK
jgi:hypothetical protein